MRITFLIILTLFFGRQTIYSQYATESDSDFNDEINEILLHTDNGKFSRIICKFNIFEVPFERSDWKWKIKFEFLNDSIIEDTQDVGIYYWIIRGGQIFDIDYDKENFIIIDNNAPIIDSADYKVCYNIQFTRTDTIYYHTRSKIDSIGKAEETVTKRTSSRTGQVTTMYKKERIGDTSYTYKFLLKSSGWTLSQEQKGWKVLTNNRVSVATDIMTKYRYETNGQITKSVVTTKSFFSYDSIGRLMAVEKFLFLDFDENWYEKHVMNVKYVTR